MAKRKANKPKHSLVVNRTNKNRSNSSNSRSTTTVRRLKMNNASPKRNAKGHILRNEYASDEKPNTYST